MRSRFAVAAFLVLGGVKAQDSSHDSHEEGDRFELARVYELESGANSLILTPAEGLSFKEEALAFMVVPAATADSGGLEEAEESAEAAWDAFIDGTAEPEILNSSWVAFPSAAMVNQVSLASPVVVFIQVRIEGAHAIFLQHGSEELTVTLASPSGVVLTAAADEDWVVAGGATASQWANALVASFIISACSFTGLLVIVNKRVAHSIGLSHAFIFASGALLTASLLHIIPEAIEGLAPEYENELHEMGLNAMLSVLGGISLGMLIHALMDSGGHSHDHSPGGGDHQHQHHDHDMAAGAGGAAVLGMDTLMASGALRSDSKAAAKPSSAPVNGSSLDGGLSLDGVPVMVDEGSLDEMTQPPTPLEPSSGNLRSLVASREGRALLDVKGLQPVCWNVVAGDLVHNFADGVTIGAAFLSCSTSIGWTVTASAILHEIPHELADFMALLKGGMSVKQAFLYNFLSALSAVLGTIMILSLGDKLTEAQTSVILLIGAGSFIFIALSELLPEALAVAGAVSDRGSVTVTLSQLRKLASFFLGAFLIGVPLLFDQHCSADGHDH